MLVISLSYNQFNVKLGWTNSSSLVLISEEPILVCTSSNYFVDENHNLFGVNNKSLLVIQDFIILLLFFSTIVMCLCMLQLLWTLCLGLDSYASQVSTSFWITKSDI